MSFETSLLDLFLFKMFIGPLIFHLGFEILTDLEIRNLLLKSLLHQYLIDVFEVNLIGPIFISLNLIFLKDSQNVLVFDYDHFFILNEEGIFIVH